MVQTSTVRWPDWSSTASPVRLGIGDDMMKRFSGSDTMRDAEVRSSVDTGRRRLRWLVPMVALCGALYTGAQTQPDIAENKTSEYAAPATCAGGPRGVWETA